MKAVKISLVVIVVAAIVFFAFRSCENIDNPDAPKPPKNTECNDSEEILKYIDELKKRPTDKFCKGFYKDTIVYYIQDNFDTKRFSDNPSYNEDCKNNFSKQAYSAYAEKFISQAFYVFNNSEWESNDLSFIRSEYRSLQSSSLLERGSPI